jgi:hypothetical protein
MPPLSFRRVASLPNLIQTSTFQLHHPPLRLHTTSPPRLAPLTFVSHNFPPWCPRYSQRFSCLQVSPPRRALHSPILLELGVRRATLHSQDRYAFPWDGCWDIRLRHYTGLLRSRERQFHRAKAHRHIVLILRRRPFRGSLLSRYRQSYVAHSRAHAPFST